MATKKENIEKSVKSFISTTKGKISLGIGALAISAAAGIFVWKKIRSGMKTKGLKPSVKAEQE